MDTEFHKKLVDRFGVNPTIFEVDTYDKSALYLLPKKHLIFLTFLILLPIAKQNINVFKNILRNHNKDGYILMDYNLHPSVYCQILSHEFVHAKQYAFSSFRNSDVPHTLPELEADIISTEFCIRQGIDVLAGINNYKKQIEIESFIAWVKEQMPTIKILVFLFVIYEVLLYMYNTIK